MPQLDIDLLRSQNVYTQAEIDAIIYQNQGSYDSKNVEVIWRDLFHRKAIGTSQNMTFFDGNLTDLTITNVNGNALPAAESFTVYEIWLRTLFVGAVATPNALVQAAINYLNTSVLELTIQNKAPIAQIPCSRFVPAMAVYADNAALTNAKTGEFYSDSSFELKVPKVIGEKVSFAAKITGGVAPAAILNTAAVQFEVGLTGLTVRGR